MGIEREEDAFDSGFDESAQVVVPTETPAIAKEDEQKPAVDSAPAEPAVEYAQITKEQLDQLLNSTAQLDTLRTGLEKQFGTAFGKIGGIERKLSEIAAIRQETEGGTSEITAEDFGDLAEDFPDLVTGMVQALNKARPKQQAPAPNEAPANVPQVDIDRLIGERIGAKETELTQRFEQRILSTQHPDWQQVRATPEFQTWVKALPQTEQDQLANSWDASYVAQALTKFKDSQKPKTAPPAKPSARQQIVAAAVSPRGDSRPSAPPGDDPFDAGFSG